jgi:hypothetical protein
MNDTQSPQEHFRMILITVVGQAYTAAGYELEELPLQWAGGRFRFRGRLEDEFHGFIEYQLLSYIDSEWASGQPSRFRVTLTRTDQPSPGDPSQHPRYARRDLSALVVEDFGVPILPSGAHWWTFYNIDELGKALAEAGHLVVGYGLPWLSGDLLPPDDE